MCAIDFVLAGSIPGITVFSIGSEVYGLKVCHERHSRQRRFKIGAQNFTAVWPHGIHRGVGIMFVFHRVGSIPGSAFFAVIRCRGVIHFLQLLNDNFARNLIW